MKSALGKNFLLYNVKKLKSDEKVKQQGIWASRVHVSQKSAIYETRKKSIDEDFGDT